MYSLRYLQTQDHLSPRQVGWLQQLIEFDFTIVPIRGKSNQATYALSHRAKYLPNTEELKDVLLPYHTNIRPHVGERIRTGTPIPGKIQENSTIIRGIRQDTVSRKIAFVFLKGNSVKNCYRTIIRPLVQDILVKRRRGIGFSPICTGKACIGPFTNTSIAVEFASRSKPEIMNCPDFFSLWSGGTPSGQLLRWPSSHHSLRPENNVVLVNVADTLCNKIRSTLISKYADPVKAAKRFKEHMTKFRKPYSDFPEQKLNHPQHIIHKRMDNPKFQTKNQKMIREFANFPKYNWDEHLV